MLVRPAEESSIKMINLGLRFSRSTVVDLQTYKASQAYVQYVFASKRIPSSCKGNYATGVHQHNVPIGQKAFKKHDLLERA